MNTKVNIAGVTFKNPIITASGTFGFGKEYNEFYDINVLGGICTKGVTLEKREGNPSPRVADTAMGMLNSVGLQNPGLDGFLRDDLEFLESLDTVVIVNVAGRTVEDYIAVAERISETKLGMIELNISCPNVKAGGMAFGIYPDSVEAITKAVRAHCTKPLIVKLSPNVASIADNARAAENGGADAISLINTLTGMAIDWKTRRTILANRTGGLSGPAVKPIALRMVNEAYNAVKIPVIGLGGIMTADDVLEFMVAGASAVQIGTANIFNPNAGLTIVNELTKILKACKIENVGDLVGTLQ